MLHKILVTTAALLFLLFTPAAGADTATPQPDPEAVSIEVARDAENDTDASRAAVIAAKRAESLGSDDIVDCFYEENRYLRECDTTRTWER